MSMYTSSYESHVYYLIGVGVVLQKLLEYVWSIVYTVHVHN